MEEEGVDPETVEVGLETAVEVVDPEIAAVVETVVAVDLLEIVVVEEEVEVVDIVLDLPQEVHAVVHLPTPAHRTKSHLKTA